MNWTPIVAMALGYFILKDVIGDGNGDKQATEDVEDFEAIGNPWSYSAFVPPPYKSDRYRNKINNFGVVVAGARIHKGIGYIYDDEAKIMSGVKLAGTKTDIAIIAKFMNSKYGYDVYEKLKKNLSKRELGRINKYVLSLPNYTSSGYRR